MFLLISHEYQFLPYWNVKDSFSPSEPYQQIVVSCVEVMTRLKVTYKNICKSGKSLLSYFS